MKKYRNYKQRKFIKVLNKNKKTIALALIVVVASVLAVNIFSKKETNTIGKNTERVSNQQSKVLRGTEIDEKELKKILSNWEDYTQGDRARYARKVKALDSSINTDVVPYKEFIDTKHRQEKEMVKEINGNLHQIFNATQSIIKMMERYSLMETMIADEDIIEEVLYYNNEIFESFENLRGMELSSRFGPFNIEITSYWRDNKIVFETVEEAMYSNSRADKEEMCNRLKISQDKFTYLLNLYDY